MPKSKEVEIKVRISENDVERVEKELFDQDFSRFTESDTYFTAPVRDFMETNECLRIRQRNGKPIELTYKGKTTEEMRNKEQFWKEEIDLPVENIEDTEQLLLAVGCERLVKVVKDRKKKEMDGKVITLDRIEDTGAFLEVETEAVERDVQKAVKDNRKFLEKLGLEKMEVVKKPYRDLVMDSKGISY
mgnify:CR=1 FL=1